MNREVIGQDSPDGEIEKFPALFLETTDERFVKWVEVFTRDIYKKKFVCSGGGSIRLKPATSGKALEGYRYVGLQGEYYVDDYTPSEKLPLGRVIEFVVIKQLQSADHRTSLRLWCPKDQSLNSGMDHCTNTHRTRLDRDI